MKLNNPFTIELVQLTGIILSLFVILVPHIGIAPVLIPLLIFFLIIKTSSAVKIALLKALRYTGKGDVKRAEIMVERAKKIQTWVDEKIAKEERKLKEKKGEPWNK